MIVCAATNNAGKLKELRRILTRCGHEVKSLRELGVTLDPEETGTTFAENAKIKAEAFCKATGLPTVADDSGLCVDALNGAPGVYSARYAGEHGNDAANNEKLMAEMQNVPVGQRAAKFVSAVCLILPDGRELVVTGECPGSVALTPAGDNGFGYDPLFVPDAVGLPGGGTVPNTAHRTYAELAELLPGARILRMDQDSTSRKDAHETMLAQFARHEYDILLGTQMVAKGLDFEKVTLVGVLGIDSLLFGQGFRAYESVFSLITQVVGRGGRAALPGRALIQTSVPDHPVLQLAAAQDYKGFYREEITFRRFSLYPPFCSFVVVGFIGDQEGAVFIAAQRFGALLGQHAAQKPNIPLRILGPAPMNITMLNNKFRYKLTLKCRNDAAFRALLHETLDAYDAEKLPQKASVILDFNSDGDL